MFIVEMLQGGTSRKFKATDRESMDRAVDTLKAKYPKATVQVYIVDDEKWVAHLKRDPYEKLGWKFGPTYSEAQEKAQRIKARYRPVFEFGLRSLRALRNGSV